MNFYDGLTFPAAGVIPFGHHRAHTPLYYGIQFNTSGTLRLRINRGREYTLTGPVSSRIRAHFLNTRLLRASGTISLSAVSSDRVFRSISEAVFLI